MLLHPRENVELFPRFLYICSIQSAQRHRIINEPMRVFLSFDINRRRTGFERVVEACDQHAALRKRFRPFAAIAKLVCDRVESLKPAGELLGR